MNIRKLLYISISVPPFPDSQSIRAAYLLRGLIGQGHKVHVVSAEVNPSRRDDSLNEILPPDVQCHRTATPRYDRLQQSLRSVALGETLAAVHANLALRLGVPDPRRQWWKDAVSLGRKVMECVAPDVILSAHGAQSAHLVAATLAQDSGLPWIADFGDPWSLLSRRGLVGRFLRRIDGRLEKSVFRHMSGIVFTTPETRAAYQQWLGAELPPSAVIPYGYWAGGHQHPAVATQTGSPLRSIALAYVGVSYKGDRDLRPVIQAVCALHQKQRFTLTIAGPHSRAYEAQVRKLGTDRITLRQRVSYRESQSILAGADVCLVVGNKGALQVPGKVYMCLASGKPVLYVGTGQADHDPSWELLRCFPGVVRCDNATENVVEALTDVATRYEELCGEARIRQQSESLRLFELEQIGAEYARFIDSVVVKQKSHLRPEHYQVPAAEEPVLATSST